MGEIDPLQLDRRLARAASRWHRWRRRLDQGHGLDENPFELDGTLAGRTTFQTLGELPDSDPLKHPLRRWIYRLAEQRLDREALVAIEIARRIELHAVAEPEDGRYTLSQLLARALSGPARHAVWLRDYTDRSATLASRVALLWERRAEIARRMDLDSPDAIELPLDSATVTEVAEQWLAGSADMASDFLRSEPAELSELALGREADDGWPARITPRAIGGLLGELINGLSIDPGPMPATLAASSFLRALQQVGAAWREALAPAHQPFVIAHDPYRLESHATGALFALLPLSRPFLQRRLGLGGARAHEQQRVIARVVLLESRAAALRVLLRPAALAGGRAFAETYEARLHEALGVELPGRVAGTLWRLHTDDAQRFQGLLLAAARAQVLTDDHDDDWFRNPRALDQLRSEAELSPEPHSTRPALDAAAALLQSVLAEALG